MTLITLECLLIDTLSVSYEKYVFQGQFKPKQHRFLCVFVSSLARSFTEHFLHFPIAKFFFPFVIVVARQSVTFVYVCDTETILLI